MKSILSNTKSIFAFLIVAIIGILLTVKIAAGSTIIALTGGLITVALAFITVRWILNWK